jgi:signal-transduction protein with cAMP-binding, CBS, and nucleotidyltransferase domain
MKVHDIMSAPPQICRVDTDLATASRYMKQTGTGMLVAIDAHGTIAGVVTDRDLALAIGTSLRDVRDRRVSEVMTCVVRSCHEHDEVHEALATMARGHVRRLPVLSADGDLKGVLSVDDIILWAVQGGGVTSKELIGALRRICLPKPIGDEAVMPRM